MHCREERRTLSRCFCQHITPLLQEIVRTRRRLEQRYYCFSKRDPRWVKEDGIRPRSCTLLLAALAFCPARACPPGNPSPSATIAAPQAGVKRRVEPCGRAWRGKGRSDCPRPDGPAEDGCPKRRGQSRVTAIPPPRWSSPCPHGRRSLGLPLRHWRAARTVQKGRAPRREASSPGCPRLTRVQESGSGSRGKPSFGQPAPPRNTGNTGHAQCFLLRAIPLRVFPATRRGGCEVMAQRNGPHAV